MKERAVILSSPMLRYARPALVALLLTSSAHCQTENDGTRIRVNVDLVSASVRVTDKHGGDVSGLTADDFFLFENGRKQKISFFDTAKEPITLSVLLDSSTSMNADDKLEIAQEILKGLVSRSRPEDEISVLQFTDHVVGFKPITSEQHELTLTTAVTVESGGTAIYDALASAMCHLRQSKNLRQAMVVITDGADQHSRLQLQELIRLVQSSRAQLFIVGFYRGRDYTVYKESGKYVTLVTSREIDNPLLVFDRLSKESGAEAYFPTTKKSLEQAVDEILKALRAQYTLSYYPEQNTGSVRRVQVKLNRGGLKIRARQTAELVGTETNVQFDADKCEVSAKAHPYPYETHVQRDGETLDYFENFADPRTGWPNHEGSRYISDGYELSYAPPKQKGDQLIFETGPVGVGSLAAYGPWWQEFRASVNVDAGWTKAHHPDREQSLKSSELLDASSAGMVFRLTDAGYYAFLLSTSPQVYQASQLSFKLVKRTYSVTQEEAIVPWTRIPADWRLTNSKGIKLTVECHGDQITLRLDGQKVAQVHDTSYTSGYIGFVSFGMRHVVFRDLHVEGTR
jgi:Ca-activated chloride channel homolog